jgi:hypothetical protein
MMKRGCLRWLAALLFIAMPATAALAQGRGLRNVRGQVLDSCGARVTPRIQRVDLNGDGTEEVFVTVPGTCEGGMAGAHLTLLIRTGNGWTSQLGFPAGGYRILPRRRGGYPDIEIALPGSCAPVWGWGGQRYQIVRRCPEPPPFSGGLRPAACCPLLSSA